MPSLNNETGALTKGLPKTLRSPLTGETGVVYLLPLNSSPRFQLEREAMAHQGRYERLQAIDDAERAELEATAVGKALLRDRVFAQQQEFAVTSPALVHVIAGWNVSEWGPFSTEAVLEWLEIGWFRDQVLAASAALDKDHQKAVDQLGNGSSGRSDGSPATEDEPAKSRRRRGKPSKIVDEPVS